MTSVKKSRFCCADYAKRKTLNRLVTGAVATTSILKAPMLLANTNFRLRVLGTHATLIEDIREKAMQDLGIEIDFQPGGSASVLHQAATRPGSFDIYEQWSNSINILWNSGSIQAIDTLRLKQWGAINELSKTGRLGARGKIGAGDSPHKILWVGDDNNLSASQSSRISFLPYVHNADSFGYNADRLSVAHAGQDESWSWLLSDAHKGKIAIVNAPTIGIFDLALAVKARGLMEFEDIGNMTRGELDKLFSIVVDFKKQGYFRGVWSSIPQSVKFMHEGDVVIESMFSPAVDSLLEKSIPCVYASPKEGYRAWHGVMCLSSATYGGQKDAAYAYMDWWLSGWAGAYIARQGYYISTPELSREFLTSDEWGYWYEGKPAESPLANSDGKVTVKAGQRRRGGSYADRFSNVAVWNTVMGTYEYSLMKWQEFLLS